MTITLNGTTGITTPDITSSAGLDAADLTGTVASARLPAGSVLQVVTSVDTTETSFASDSWNDTTLTATITPKLSNSKFICFVTLGLSGDHGGAEGAGARLVRSLPPATADTVCDGVNPSSWGCHMNVPGNQGTDPYAPQSCAFNVYDSPSVSAGTPIKYKLQIRGYSVTYPVYYNRGQNLDSDSNGRWQTAATLVIQEVAA